MGVAEVVAGAAVVVVVLVTVVSVDASGATSSSLQPTATRTITPKKTSGRQPRLARRVGERDTSSNPDGCLAKNMKSLVTTNGLRRPMVNRGHPIPPLKSPPSTANDGAQVGYSMTPTARYSTATLSTSLNERRSVRSIGQTPTVATGRRFSRRREQRLKAARPQTEPATRTAR